MKKYKKISEKYIIDKYLRNLHFKKKETFDFLSQFSEELRFLFITSSVDLQLDSNHESNDELSVGVKKSDAQKCGRCWHRQETVGASAEHPEICARCISNISDNEEQRLFF